MEFLKIQAWTFKIKLRWQEILRSSYSPRDSRNYVVLRWGYWQYVTQFLLINRSISTSPGWHTGPAGTGYLSLPILTGLFVASLQLPIYRSLYSWVETEGHCKSKVACRRTQHYDLPNAWDLAFLIPHPLTPQCLPGFKARVKIIFIAFYDSCVLSFRRARDNLWRWNSFSTLVRWSYSRYKNS